MDHEHSRWKRWLQGESVTQQAEALRQIATHDGVQGLAVRCVELAGSHDDEVRLWAAEALETAVSPRAEEAAALARLLDRSDDGEIVYWAATLLGRLGPAAAETTPALDACLRWSLYLPARERAAWALSRIGPKAAAAVPTLRQVADDAPPRLRRLVLQALDSIGGVAA